MILSNYTKECKKITVNIGIFIINPDLKRNNSQTKKLTSVYCVAASEIGNFLSSLSVKSFTNRW